MRERQPHAKSNHCAHPINNDSLCTLECSLLGLQPDAAKPKDRRPLLSSAPV